MGRACIESIPYSDRAINIMRIRSMEASGKAQDISWRGPRSFVKVKKMCRALLVYGDVLVYADKSYLKIRRAGAKQTLCSRRVPRSSRPALENTATTL